MKKSQVQTNSRKLHGVAASPGIAIGRAVVLANQQWGQPRRLAGPAEVSGEEDRLAAAVSRAGLGLLELKKDVMRIFRNLSPLLTAIS